MKKLVLIVPLLLALSTSGCAGLDFSRSILQGGASLTANVGQPVTPRMVSDAENGLKVAVAGLTTYRRLCIAGKADQNCRATIESIQRFTRVLCSTFVANKCATGMLADLRRFVRQNDQVNAIATFKLVKQLIDDVRATRTAAGV